MSDKNELTEETLQSEWFAHNEWQQHHPTMPAHRLFAKALERGFELGQKGQSWKVDWNSPEKPPQVSEFDNATFWISVESKHTGKTHAYDAIYMNYPLILDDDEEPLGDCLCTGDGDAVEIVGWANKIYHPEFADYYELIQFSDQYILKGWAEYKTPESPGE